MRFTMRELPHHKRLRPRMMMEFRRWLADVRAPHYLRVAFARPGAYHLARTMWEWPRRHAFMEAIAPLFDRSYHRGPRATAVTREKVERAASRLHSVGRC